MQQRPDVATTLDAILRFLLSDVHPTVTDKGLQFRVLVAVNALSQCAAELRAEPSRSSEELARLRALLPDVGVDSGVDSTGPALVAALDRALAERLRDGRISAAVDGEAARHLERSLRATLEATNPRFDLSDTIE
jgi:hypothetical protein